MVGEGVMPIVRAPPAAQMPCSPASMTRSRAQAAFVGEETAPQRR